MNHIKRYQILCKLRDNDVDPSIELVYRSEFELLIAVLLSAQTNDIQVNKVTENLFKIANTPKSMLRLGINGIKNYIKSLGLYNTKAKNIIKSCHVLIEHYNGVLPSNRVELESLPGVGRKTANIILNLIFGRPTIAVDRHVFRFCNRSRFALGKNVLSVEKKLLSVVPKEFKNNCHQWLVLHGKNVCQAKRPNCRVCVIKDLCEFKEKQIYII
ncbi:endonuclease III [Blochmannia endosymbiont of Camponotus nipponensis]|uniref:endonuclease III n=1 Tax=Blochmannia endosymbiont of Camponotus nipponensis TaxID=2681986 RepID=UPI00135CDAE2|nr:endonuclease III [Blochmannia endosymbiont of Camponotus nipponensis]